LDGQYSGPEDYFQILFQFGFNYDLLVQQEARLHSPKHCRGKYIAASAATREVVWLRKLLSDLFSVELEPTIIHCDNQSCIKLSENPKFHDRLKHIEMKYHYVRDMVQTNILSIHYVSTTEQTADILTSLCG
jgi:hypothetical protein